MNRDKTHLFHAGLSDLEAVAISRHGFPIASLPIRYLGLPLMHRKLRISEYEPLLDQIARKFRSWAVKSLSYAGRTQLISSVIYGIINFWLSTFSLPKGCLKKIESFCSRFLWAGNIDGSKGAKVSWSTVCLPKCEGGLGLRRLTDWNSTLSLRFIWFLFSENVSLWTQWHKYHNIKASSFWELKESPRDSWTWKALLRLRPLAARFVKAFVGNGDRVSFWFDSWTPLGPLINLLGHQGPRSLRLPREGKVKDACSATSWIIPSPRSEEALLLHVHLTTIPVPAPLSQDEYCWVVDGIKCNGYSAQRTWSALRPRADKVPWSSQIWFKGAVPRHAFNMWIANLNRLPTKQRMCSWGIITSLVCSLCSLAKESRDHLLLTCSYSAQVWLQILARIDPSRPLFISWGELLSWLRASSVSAPSILRKVAAQTTVYHIWKQRNNVVHNQIIIPTANVFKLINREIKNIITVRQPRRKLRHLMQLWIS